MTYTNFRKELKKFMYQVNDAANVVKVTGQDGNNSVVLSERDYDSIMETISNSLESL